MLYGVLKEISPDCQNCCVRTLLFLENLKLVYVNIALNCNSTFSLLRFWGERKSFDTVLANVCERLGAVWETEVRVLSRADCSPCKILASIPNSKMTFKISFSLWFERPKLPESKNNVWKLMNENVSFYFIT